MCARLATEHPDRKISQWRAREEANGDWTVVKIALPPNSPGDLTAEVRADERPATADDPGVLRRFETCRPGRRG